MTSATSSIARYYANNEKRFISELVELLKFPTISADPSHDKDCRNCAKWLARNLSGIGLKSRLLETPGKPVVFAERIMDRNRPTILVYGHYDVQPVDPIDLWKTPPFAPVIKGDNIFARGAEDNKGQFFYVIKALEALIALKLVDCNIKVILEGEEEFSSHGMSVSLPKWKQLVKADSLIVTDVNTVNSGEPTIIMGLRGIVQLTVELDGPSYDLHSGSNGGVAPNPATAMARLIATLHKDDGSIAVKGFYKDVAEPTRNERKMANSVKFDKAQYKKITGVDPVGGEKRFSPAERLGFRPTIEVNGIHSGYGGPGSKTIIPSKSIAKITSRLVEGQDPDKMLGLIIDHLKSNTPVGMKLTLSDKHVAGPAIKIDAGSTLVKKAALVLKKLTGIKPVYLWEGASVPVITKLARTSGADTLFVGFGNAKHRAHAPNEYFEKKLFKLGYLFAAEMIQSGK